MNDPRRLPRAFKRTAKAGVRSPALIRDDLDTIGDLQLIDWVTTGRGGSRRNVDFALQEGRLAHPSQRHS